MSALHRIVCMTALCLAFLILLTIRLDRYVDWSWIIIFIPLWIMDLIMFFFDLVHLIIALRSIRQWHSVRAFVRAHSNRLLSLGAVALLTVFEMLLCMRLQGYALVLPVVLLPFWTLAIGLLIFVFRKHIWPKVSQKSD